MGLWAQGANMPRSVIERPLRHENAADDCSFVHAFKPLAPNLVLRAHTTDVFVDPRAHLEQALRRAATVIKQNDEMMSTRVA